MSRVESQSSHRQIDPRRAEIRNRRFARSRSRRHHSTRPIYQDQAHQRSTKALRAAKDLGAHPNRRSFNQILTPLRVKPTRTGAPVATPRAVSHAANATAARAATCHDPRDTSAPPCPSLPRLSLPSDPLCNRTGNKVELTPRIAKRVRGRQPRREGRRV